MNVSSSASYALQYAAQAPPALAPAATAQAADIMVAAKALDAIDAQGQAALQLLDSVAQISQMAQITGVGTRIDTYA